MKFGGSSCFFLLAASLVTGCSSNRSAPSHQTAAIDVHQSAGFSVSTAECYALSYSDPRGDARELLFPIWVALFRGNSVGPADGKPNPGFGDWAGITEAKMWRGIAADSVEVMFTGRFEGVSIRAARMGSAISGRAIWLTDVIGGPIASMRVVGTREICPSDLGKSK